MLKYALRYLPLLVLALLFIPLRTFIENWEQKNPTFLYSQASQFRPGSGLYGVTMLSSQDVWAVGGSFVAQCDINDKSRCFAVPSRGIILHYVDHAWIGVSSVSNPLLSIAFDSAQDGWAVGYEGTLVHYDGKTWSVVPGPVHMNKNLLGIAMLSSSDGWAVGYGGTILYYDGKRWSQVQSPTSVDLRGIAMSSPQEGWAIGDSGTLLHYSLGGWRVANSPTRNTLKSISMLSSDEGWAVGDNGTILHYRLGTWERVYPADYYRDQHSYQSVNFLGVAMASLRSGWIVGDQYSLTYSSEAWISSGKMVVDGKYAQQAPDLYSVTISPSNEVWAVGSVSGDYSSAMAVFHYQNGVWDVSVPN